MLVLPVVLSLTKHQSAILSGSVEDARKQPSRADRKPAAMHNRCDRGFPVFDKPRSSDPRLESRMPAAYHETMNLNYQSFAWKFKRRAGDLRKWIGRKNRACPCCGATESIVVDTKKLITALRRCVRCQLLFRTPTFSEDENSSHYNAGGDRDFAACPPSDENLERLLATKFDNSDGEFGSYIAVLKALGCREGSRVLDFGCSWGYRSWQLKQAGFNVQGFEINQETCGFARTKLGIDAYSSLDELTPPFDVFFSNHVLEHVPKLRETIDRGWKMVRPGGLFIAFTPNGSTPAPSPTTTPGTKCGAPAISTSLTTPTIVMSSRAARYCWRQPPEARTPKTTKCWKGGAKARSKTLRSTSLAKNFWSRCANPQPNPRHRPPIVAEVCDLGLSAQTHSPIRVIDRQL